MASTTVLGVVKNHIDTAANLTSANATPLKGEITIESDTGQIKVGDGATAWASLPYFNPGTVGEFKSFATYKDRAGLFLFPFAYGNSVSTTTYATLYAEIGNIYEAQHVSAGDPASGGSAFYPTPVPAAYGRIGIPDITFINTNVSSNLLTYSTPSGFRDGTIFRYELLTGTTITNLSSGTEYYLRRVSSTTLSIHATEYDAITDTSAIAIADGGAGTFKLTQEGVSIADAFQGMKFSSTVIQRGNVGTTFTPYFGGADITGGTPGELTTGSPLTDTINGTPRFTNETRSNTYYEFKYIKYI